MQLQGAGIDVIASYSLQLIAFIFNLSSSSHCTPPYTNCRRKVLLNVTGEPHMTLDVDGWTKKSIATLRNEHGSETTITSGYSTKNIDVEFIGDKNIFVHVNLKVG